MHYIARMKTKAAFTSLLGLAVATSIFAGSMAQAQMKTSIASKKTNVNGQAHSQLKAKVKTAAPAKKEESPFSLNIGETYYGKMQNEDNYLENWLTAGYKFNENVSFTVETGFDAYMEKQEKNQGYDLEANLMVSGMEITKDFTFAAGLIGVLSTSRESRDDNKSGAFGGRGNFGLKLGTVSLGLDNNFYQIAYKKAPIATPEADLFDGDDDKRYYGNEYTRATTVLSAVVPVGGFKLKNDLRYRQSTPYEGEETRSMRYRARVSYGITDALSITGGAWWAKKITDPKAMPFFNEKNRTFFLSLSLDV